MLKAAQAAQVLKAAQAAQAAQVEKAAQVPKAAQAARVPRVAQVAQVPKAAPVVPVETKLTLGQLLMPMAARAPRTAPPAMTGAALRQETPRMPMDSYSFSGSSWSVFGAVVAADSAHLKPRFSGRRVDYSARQSPALLS